MFEDDFERELKVIVVGNGEVGKTSMIRRFCTGAFTDGYKKTIGVDFMERQFYVKSIGQEVKTMLWDTAGQEEYDALTRTYYRGAAACVLVFSTTDRKSFEAVKSWKDKVEKECGHIAMALVQNKVDLLDQAVVSPSEAEELADTLGLKFYRSCVKENLQVSEVFESLAETAIRNQNLAQANADTPKKKSHSRPEGRTQRDAFATESKQSADPADDGEEGEEHFREYREDNMSNASATIDFNKPSKQRTGGKKRRMGACSIS